MGRYYETLKRSLEQAEAKESKAVLADRFFRHFFERFPETQEYFSETDISKFGPEKFTIISQFLLDMVRHPDFAEAELTDEVRRHLAYGLKDKDYYFALIDALEQTIRESFPGSWGEQQAESWHDVSLAMKGVIGRASAFV